MNKIFVPIILFVVLYSCGQSEKKASLKAPEKTTIEEEPDKIDSKYITYLQEYYPNGLGNNGEIVEIKRISNRTFWVTSIWGSGTRSDIYWILSETKLIPSYEVEYGGINWESEMSYFLKNIETNKKIEGTVYGVNSEQQISEKIEKFISSH
jgi:hypothetical protein